eukprot:gene13573-13698_t
MAYSLGIRCLSEFIGMIIVIYTGEAALANELLPSTKGHAMGWGWTVFTFGFAFLAPLQIFSKVSAKLNPAMCLAQWVWGNLTGIDFICLSLADIAGAFVGAVLHWMHYLPHYKTLPEPAPGSRDDALLRRRDHMRESALQIASYATRPDRRVTRNPVDPLKNTLYYLRQNSIIHEETPEQILEEYYHSADALQRRASHSVSKSKTEHNPLARRTVQVADLQRHLKDAHVETVLRQRVCPKCTSHNNRSFSSPGEDTGNATEQSNEAAADVASQQDVKGAGAQAGLATQFSLNVPPTPSKRQTRMEATFGSEAVEQEKERANALYQAAITADQNAKLSIFATRPAIYSPMYNFITEAMGTTALLLLVLLIELQGGSEWSYAWIPFFAPLVGGAVAGVLYIAIEEMQFPGGGSKGGGLFVG